MVLRVLQGAGNGRDSLLLARHELVDGVSADVWLHNGEVYVHDEYRFAPLRFAVGRGGVRRGQPRRIPLDAVIDAVDARLLVLDVRAGGGDPAPDIARALYALPDRSRFVVACEELDLMERLRAWQPDLPVAYAIPSEGALRRYVQARMSNALPPMAVIVSEALLHTRLEMESLAARATSVGVRNVRTAERARELAAWGAHLVMASTLEALVGVSEATTQA